jgi:hypothetical protein
MATDSDTAATTPASILFTARIHARDCARQATGLYLALHGAKTFDDPCGNADALIHLAQTLEEDLEQLLHTLGGEEQ